MTAMKGRMRLLFAPEPASGRIENRISTCHPADDERKARRAGDLRVPVRPWRSPPRASGRAPPPLVSPAHAPEQRLPESNAAAFLRNRYFDTSAGEGGNILRESVRWTGHMPRSVRAHASACFPDRNRDRSVQRLPDPTVAARSTWRIEKLREDRFWLERYEDAKARLRAGEPGVSFPFGTWKLRVYYRVTCDDPPVCRFLVA